MAKNTILGIFTLMISFSIELAFSNEMSDYEKLKTGVVKIISQKRQGTGFVLRKDKNKIYILTAAHVIKDQESVDRSPIIELFDHSEFANQWVKLEKAQLDIDLALFSLENQHIPDEVLPLNFFCKSLDKLNQTLEKREQVIFTMGFPRGGPWLANEKLHFAGRDLINISWLNFSYATYQGNYGEGISGSPVIKDNEVIGMVSHRKNYIHAISVLTVQQFLSSFGLFACQSDPEIEKLLQTCQEHYNANRLTSGYGGTALSCYGDVLKRDPTNKKALQGIKNIENHYIKLVKLALNETHIELAQLSLIGLRLVNPESPELFELEQQVIKHSLTVCQLHLMSERFDTARTCYEYVLTLDSTNAMALNGLKEIDNPPKSFKSTSPTQPKPSVKPQKNRLIHAEPEIPTRMEAVKKWFKGFYKEEVKEPSAAVTK